MLSRQLEVLSPQPQPNHVAGTVLNNFQQQIADLYDAPEPVVHSCLTTPPGLVNMKKQKEVIPHFEKVIQIAENRSYGIERKLGEGAFGTVLKAYSYEDKCYYAIKEQKRVTAEGAKMIDREIHNNELLASRLPDTEFSVLFVQYFDYQNAFYIVMEKLDFDLFTFLDRLDGQSLHVKYVRNLAHQILSAVAELHEVGLVHCDMKLENVMFVDRKSRNQWKIKLIDFGLLKDVSALSELQGKQFGTRSYWSPEIFLGLPLSEKADLWAIGIMLMELYCGQRMFNTDEKCHIFGNLVRMFGTPDDAQHGLHFKEYFYQKSNRFDSPKWRESVAVDPEECWYPYTGFENLFEFVYINDDVIEYSPTKDDLMFKDILQELLNTDAEERISAREALKHPFFNNLAMH